MRLLNWDDGTFPHGLNYYNIQNSLWSAVPQVLNRIFINLKWMLTCILLCLSLNPSQKALIRVVLLHNVYILIILLPKPNVPRTTKNAWQKAMVAASSILFYKQKEQQTPKEKK